MARALDESPARAARSCSRRYVVGGLLVVPVTVLIVATGIVFGPLLGSLYAFAGALLSAAVTYCDRAAAGPARRAAARRARG